MAKRGADNYLTHDNYNDEDEEEEERGTFKKASNTTLNTRDIKKAKRRFGGQDVSSSGGSFQAFTGLTSSKANGAPTFSFGGITNKPVTSLTAISSSSVVPPVDSVSTGNVISLSKSLGVTQSSTVSSSPAVTFSFVSNNQQLVSAATCSSQNSSTESSNKATKVMTTMPNVDTNSKQQSNYAREIKALNEGFLRWVEQQLKMKPVCLLTPIFADYQRYADELDKKYPVDGDQSAATESTGSGSNSVPASSSGIGAFGFQLPASTANKGFQATELFGNAASSSAVTTASLPTSTLAPSGTFTFGSIVSTSAGSGSGLFNTSTNLFGAVKPATAGNFTFGAGLSAPASDNNGSTSSGWCLPNAGPVAKPPAAETVQAAEGEDDEYLPPKPEVVEVKEDDAFYTVKCKLFYKKETIWQERGVGNLFLKPCGGKTQLLIRADTNLGNILLNIVLNKSIPISRQGTNNVSLICVPNPPIERNKDDKAPVCLLIRVKTSETADELLNQMNSNKN